MACEQRELLHGKSLEYAVRSSSPACPRSCVVEAVSLESSFARWVCVADNIPFSPQRRSVATDPGSTEIPVTLESAIRCIPRSGLVQTRSCRIMDHVGSGRRRTVRSGFHGFGSDIIRATTKRPAAHRMGETGPSWIREQSVSPVLFHRQV